MSKPAPRDNPFIPSWLDDLPLKPSAIRILCHLWRRADNVTKECYPSRSSIAKHCGFSVKTVGTALKELKRLGLVTSKRRFGISNSYELFIPNKNGKVNATDNSIQSGSIIHHQSVSSLHQVIGQNRPSKGTPNKGTSVSEETPFPDCCEWESILSKDTIQHIQNLLIELNAENSEIEIGFRYRSFKKKWIKANKSVPETETERIEVFKDYLMDELGFTSNVSGEFNEVPF